MLYLLSCAFITFANLLYKNNGFATPFYDEQLSTLYTRVI